MRKALFLSIMGVIITLQGCGPSEAEIKAEQARKAMELKAEIARKEKEDEDAKIEYLKKKVKDILKDPQSAQFRNIQFIKPSNSLCGEVNAKNSMGGYVGFKPFGVSADGDPVILQKMSLNSVIWSHETAIKAASAFMLSGDSSSANDIIVDIAARDSFPHWESCVTNPDLKKQAGG